ncbi:protein of unknown function DUF3343 [Syntrophotalea carbinolica DSM 2380]|uniref:Putative Se/S carrier protein-like domain-containing protein n=1 Tax=Syntrophotalea carbinolica (strain DSM 2380 / NBRC 103641 / GraBd1) TaxID=338963 RepID=Q3A3T6_SYNC1|nr:DUF3343 domain-containing protein [Syntrophotalea carbinolica]ABA88971.1 protein of unknown function DUF3343 [Syntrophotalea carbinolica DSM 2380]
MLSAVSETDLLALFETGHEVLKAEKVLKQADIQLRLLPAPAGLATGCTLAIRFEAVQRQAVEKALEAEELRPKAIYRREQDRWQVA